MNANWQQMIGDRPPRTAAEGPSASLTLYDLSAWGLIRVSGEDAEPFLQGQFTVDVKKVNGEAARVGAFCTPKGRMLATFLLFRRAGAYYLWLPLDSVPLITKKLSMYVLMSKVKIEDVSEGMLALGVGGETAAAAIAATGVEAPADDWTCTEGAAASVIRLPGGRFILAAADDYARSVWSRLAADAEIAEREAWLLQDIRSGLPTVFAATSERFIPQMLNLPALGGVSFDKGCYTGQEVVARMKYLGKVKRRMYRATASALICPAPGEAIHSGAASKSGQGAGSIVAAVRNESGVCEMLSVIEQAGLEADDLRLEGAAGPKIQVLDLPYRCDD